MGRLTDIFSSDDNSSDTSGMLHGTLDNTLGIDASSSSERSETDEDGNSSSSSNDTDLSLDNSTDGLLHGVTDSMSSSDDSDIG